MILTRPYSERQILVVVPPNHDQAEVTALSCATTDRHPEKAKESVSFMPGLLRLAAGPIAGEIVSNLLAQTTRTSGGGTNSGAVTGALAVTHDAATRELSFPPGHPLLDHAYAGHPLAPNYYIPIETFHRFLFDEKANELITLLASLGASRVKMSCSRGYRTAAGISIGVAKGAEFGAGVSGTSEKSQEASYEEHFRPRGEPKIPANLIWYPSEAAWQAIAQRRLNFGTTRFKIKLSYEDSFGIDGKLKLGLDQIGVKLGGNYTEFESTEWDFEGEFS